MTSVPGSRRAAAGSRPVLQYRIPKTAAPPPPTPEDELLAIWRKLSKASRGRLMKIVTAYAEVDERERAERRATRKKAG